jgi:DNA repair photolyase
MAINPTAPEKGRGATFNPGNRFAHTEREIFDDGWAAELERDVSLDGEAPAPLKTVVTIQQARTIISHNDSPDIGFSQSINPYQGCEHGCIYCYARPSHAYLDLSPGLDFESKLFAKPEAAALLRKELNHPRYRPEVIVVGANTDPYQPIEREWKITRSLLEVFLEYRHPVALITKSALVERDIDVLAELARHNLVRVMVSITSLDKVLARRMEPRAAAPHRRLEAVKKLTEAGIPVGVMTAPMIPALNDGDMEAILDAAAARGATMAGYTFIRLPYEIKDLFKAWLAEHYPQRAEHVMSVIRQMRGGKDYDSTFGQRMHGTGNFAELLEQRFAIACRRLKLNQDREPLETALFRRPSAGGQMSLFAECR